MYTIVGNHVFQCIFLLFYTPLPYPIITFLHKQICTPENVVTTYIHIDRMNLNWMSHWRFPTDYECNNDVYIKSIIQQIKVKVHVNSITIWIDGSFTWNFHSSSDTKYAVTSLDYMEKHSRCLRVYFNDTLLKYFKHSTLSGLFIPIIFCRPKVNFYSMVHTVGASFGPRPKPPRTK